MLAPIHKKAPVATQHLTWGRQSRGRKCLLVVKILQVYDDASKEESIYSKDSSTKNLLVHLTYCFLREMLSNRMNILGYQLYTRGSQQDEKGC